MSIVKKVTTRATSPITQTEERLADLIHAVKNELASQIDTSHEALRTEIGVQSRTIAGLRAEVSDLTAEVALLRGDSAGPGNR